MSGPRALYTLAWFAALPLVAGYLLYRGLRQPDYRRHWAERFLGAGPRPAGGPVVWVHAVSVGETRAAQPLIEALAAARPQLRFVLTHMTPTGRAAGAEFAAKMGGRVVQRYLPYELPFALRRFLRELRPAVGLVMETEVWPNLLAGARAAAVPVVLVNARLSERSLARALRFPRLMAEAARGFALVLAQSTADAARLQRFYAGPLEVVGNLKFDFEPPAGLVARGRAQRAAWAAGAAVAARPVWLFASSRDGEEALLLDALDARQAAAADGARAPIVIVVPRHPQRFDTVARLVEARGRPCLRRSRAPWPDAPPPPAILLGDTMGEMALYYAAADAALVGGSLRPFGAQNLIEACAVGTPVVLGPSVFNFAQVAADAVAAGAARQAADADAAVAALADLCADPLRLAVARGAASAFAQAHRGATARSVARLLQVIDGERAAAGAGI